MKDREAPPLEAVRTLLLRALAFVYAVAFLSLFVQLPGLFGDRGILPARLFVETARELVEHPFWEAPSIFWWIDPSDTTLQMLAAAGFVLALGGTAGLRHPALFALLWALYLSFVSIGQTFYGFGWEMLLLEAGALAILLAPWRAGEAVSPVVIGLFRWLHLRVWLGAGLIKLRGDACWRDLTCLDFHFETQPNPNPLSPWFHFLPHWVHAGGVVANHVVELGLPLLVFGPRPARLLVGWASVVFQVVLILSGNLSFLNWLTMVVAIACFDDKAWPFRVFRREAPPMQRAGFARSATLGWAGVVALLSIQPVLNMLSPTQAMNQSFDPFHFVNTYGAFGSIGQVRYELVIEGTADEHPGPTSEWRAYDFPCKPTDPAEPPCLVSPYHYRVDWQLWFAAMSEITDEPWLLHLVAQLLVAEPTVLDLLERDPFEGEAPGAIRIERYVYRFAPFGSDAWWERERVGPYLRPMTRDDPVLAEIMQAYGWTWTAPTP
jgi:hypothetical protein